MNLDEIKLYIVVPCYNEEEVLNETSRRLQEKMTRLIEENKISKESKVLFVDDGSKDKTWNIIEELHKKDKMFRGVKLSRNKGHQNALLAGLMVAKENCTVSISMDADLQDDINAIDEMLLKYKDGSEIVYGVRKARTTDTTFKRVTAQWYYKILEMLGANIVYNHADYRLMSKKALDELEKYSEVNLFLRGIVPMIGFKTSEVYYDRQERFAGESKYPLKKMITFAMEGITSLSIKPIRFITTLGILIFVVSVIVIIYCLVQHMLGETIQGWTSTTISVWLIGGLNLMALGVIGEYIGKIYLETKHRPKYVIEAYLKD